MTGRVLNGRYRSLESVGSGGMANVYRGERITDGQVVAIKVLKEEYAQDGEFLEQFHREERSARQLHHPNIIATLDMGQDGDLHYIVLEYIQGRTLKELIQERGRLPADQALEIAIQLCDAVQHAHAHRIIHRDIKPQNVLLDAQGRVKLSDFGIAKAASSATATLNNHSLLGSVQYASPEQARGGFVDEKSDLYSLGIVLYEMVAGTLPFKGESAVSIAIKHIQETVIPPRAVCPEIPRSLECVILKAIEKVKSRRYQSAQELGEDLRRVQADPQGDWFHTHEEGLERTAALPRLQDLPPVEDGEEAPPPAPRRNGPEVFFTVLKILVGVIVTSGLAITLVLISNSIRAGQMKPEVARVPNVTGQTEAEARNALLDQGFTVELQTETSDGVAAGMVIRTSPAVDSEVSPGSRITIYVSEGVGSIEMPTLTDLTREQAESELSQRGLKLDQITYEVLEGKPGGYVVFQDPEPGTMLASGDEVNIVLSAEPEELVRALPSVVGMKLEEARAQLKSQHFQPILVIADAGDQPAGFVYRQYPEATPEGVMGSAITLWKAAEAEEDYSRTLWLDLSVNRASTQVRVGWRDAAGEESTLYDQRLQRGEHTLQLDVTDADPGAYTLVYYFDDREVRRLEVQVAE